MFLLAQDSKWRPKQSYNVRAVDKEEIQVNDRVLYLNYNLANNRRALAVAYKPEVYVVLRKIGSNYLIKMVDDLTMKSEQTVHCNQIPR